MFLRMAQRSKSRSGCFAGRDVLFHNGVVRQTPKAKVRQGIDDGPVVTGVEFAYDAAKVDTVIAETYKQSMC